MSRSIILEAFAEDVKGFLKRDVAEEIDDVIACHGICDICSFQLVDEREGIADVGLVTFACGS